MSHVNLRRPSWSLIGKSVKTEEFDAASRSSISLAPLERTSMKKAKGRVSSEAEHDGEEESSTGADDMDSDFVDPEGAADSEMDLKDDLDDQDYTDLQVLSDDDDDFKPEGDLVVDETSKKRSKGGAAYKFLCEDDGDEMHYQKRLKGWAQKRRHLRWRVQHVSESRWVLNQWISPLDRGSFLQ